MAVVDVDSRPVRWSSRASVAICPTRHAGLLASADRVAPSTWLPIGCFASGRPHPDYGLTSHRCKVAESTGVANAIAALANGGEVRVGEQLVLGSAVRASAHVDGAAAAEVVRPVLAPLAIHLDRGTRWGVFWARPESALFQAPCAPFVRPPSTSPSACLELHSLPRSQRWPARLLTPEATVAHARSWSGDPNAYSSCRDQGGPGTVRRLRDPLRAGRFALGEGRPEVVVYCRHGGRR